MAKKKKRRSAQRPSAPLRPAAPAPQRREHKQEARERRERALRQARRRATIRRAVVFAAAAVAVLVTFQFLTRVGAPKALARAAEKAAQGAGCTGVQQPVAANPPGGLHDPPYVYDQHPATSGHHTDPLPKGVQAGPMQDQNVVHNLEHGYVAIYYRDGALPDDVVKALAAVTNVRGEVVMGTYDQLPDGVDLAFGAWNRLQTCPAGPDLTARRARTVATGFIDAFQNTNIAPESRAG